MQVLQAIDFQTITVDVFLIEVAMSAAHRHQVRNHLRARLRRVRRRLHWRAAAQAEAAQADHSQPAAGGSHWLAQSDVRARAEGGGVPAALLESRARRQCSAGAGRLRRLRANRSTATATA